MASARAERAVVLYRDERLPAPEIARRLGCTKQAVHKALRRAGVEMRPCHWRAEPKDNSRAAIMRRSYAKRKAGGRCAYFGCGNAPEPARVLCAACRDLRRRQRLARTGGAES